MEKTKKIIYSLDQIDQVADKLYTLIPYCSVFTFTGSLGAGKTTLIKSLLARCGIKDIVTSPTYTYVVPYVNIEEKIFYHFDLYRLNTLEDFINAGFDEFLYMPNSWAFIEWPEIIMPILQKKLCQISINYIDENKRELIYTLSDDVSI